MKDIRDQTYYELLEIDSNASQEEILKAYNRARATYGHNNPALYSLFNKEEAQELLKLVDEAYGVLSNQYKRKQYDTKTMGKVETLVLPPLEKPKEKPAPTRPVAQPVNSKPAPKITDKKEVPGVTSFGEYTPDPLFEDEIKAATEFGGPFLKKIRLYKKITLDQICESIKISRSYLMAIESDTYTSLPAPVFVRGFLVQLSKVMGLDSERVVKSYMKSLNEAQKK